MKRTILIGVLVFGVGMAVSAWAQGPYRGGAWGPCWYANTPEAQALVREVAPLRDELYKKRLEYHRLLSDPQADPQRIGTVAREIYDLRSRIWERAQKAGVPCGGLHMGGGRGWGHGWGRCPRAFPPAPAAFQAP